MHTGFERGLPMRPSATTPVRAVLVGVQVALFACGEGSTARHHTTQHHTTDTDTPQQWSRAELSLADNASVALTSILNNAVNAVNETVAKFDARPAANLRPDVCRAHS